MHTHSIAQWQHRHVFLGAGHARNERNVWLVVALTAVMMVAEISGGMVFGSMALLADGWHMSTHVAALSISALAYRFASKHAEDERFSFGTGKVGDLAAFASACILGLVALLIGYESLMRLFSPVSIQFNEALVVASIGLAVNLFSAWLLFDSHDHGHRHDHDDHADAGHDRDHDDHDHHDHDHDHDHAHGHDTNIRAAYLHVVADALTSILAIAALLIGRFQGWVWLDPIIGIVGAVVISHWSLGLLRASGAVLLDMVPNRNLANRIRKSLETGDDRVADLHVWQLGPGHIGVIASIVTDELQPSEVYKARLEGVSGLSHVTIEVQLCADHHALSLAA